MRMTALFHRVCCWGLFLALLCPPTAQAFPALDRTALLEAMSQELARAKTELKLPEFEAPYFLSYTLKVREQRGLSVRFGSVYRAPQSSDADLSVMVRVGSYEFDNTGSQDATPFFLDEGLPVSTAAPLDGDLTALRTALWLLTDEKYKQALSQYQAKRGKEVYEKRDTTKASFSQETASVYSGPELPFAFDDAAWKARLIALSERFKAHPEILQHRVTLSAEKQLRIFVNSEGSKVADERVLYYLQVDAETRAAKDDMVLSDSRAFYSPSEARLAPQAEMEKGVDRLIDELLALRRAPLVDPYSGPAILSPEATAVLMHEAVGHRLEGDRQNNDEEGHTYKGHLEMAVMPEFLDLLDDPTMSELQGIPLNGTYAYDDEAVKAQPVTLVKNGRLTNFLLSRTPVEGFPKSNGHGRAAQTRDPMARMSNTLLVSRKAVSPAALKAKLIELVKKQGKPYGLMIEDMEGGSTNTSSYGYQAFKGVPRVVRRIYPDGREELVRGVELVGTPLASINKILVTGDVTRVFNGFCGAESGFVPVSSSAPAVLLSELELQRKKEEKARPPVLSSPFSGPAK